MLAQEERKQIILRLFIALKESNIFPGYTLLQIKEAAIRAEQRIYEESSSREEYLRGMNERFKRIQNAVSGGGNRGSAVSAGGNNKSSLFVGQGGGVQSKTPRGQESPYFQMEQQAGDQRDFSNYNPGMKPQNFMEQGYQGRSNEYMNYMKGSQEMMGPMVKPKRMQGRLPSEQDMHTPLPNVGMVGMGQSKGFREINNNMVFQGQTGNYRDRMGPGNMHNPNSQGMNYMMGGSDGFGGGSMDLGFDDRNNGRPHQERTFPVGGANYPAMGERNPSGTFDQNYLHMQEQAKRQSIDEMPVAGGYQQKMGSPSYGYGNQSSNAGLGGMPGRYGDGAGGRSKSEHFIKSPLNMNSGDPQDGNRRFESNVFGGGAFVSPKYREQPGHESDPMFHAAPENLNRSPFSFQSRIENGYARTSPGYFVPPNGDGFGYKRPISMQKTPSFPNPPMSDPISFSSAANSRNQMATPFPMDTSHDFHRKNMNWTGFSPAFNRPGRKQQEGKVSPGTQGTRSAPIFFNQQIQHQSFNNIPQNIEQPELGMGRRRPTPSFSDKPNSAQPFQSVFNTIVDDSFLSGRVGSSPIFPKEFEGNPEYLTGISGMGRRPSKEENRHGVGLGDGRSSHGISWPQDCSKGSFSPNSAQSPLDSAASKQRPNGWFNEGNQFNREVNAGTDIFSAGRGVSATVPPENQGKNRNYDKDENKSAKSRESTDIFKQMYPNEMSLSRENTASITKKQSVIPAEVEAFLKENKTERVYLSDSEILSLETKLKEGMEIINKSSKVYNAFKESFPASELSKKYETIRNLLERQSEYFKHGAYFLKTRSVDNFIDQVKSITVDMSYDLKSSIANTEDVNHGECLRNAVKAFIEKKKKSEGFCLNIANRDET